MLAELQNLQQELSIVDSEIHAFKSTDPKAAGPLPAKAPSKAGARYTAAQKAVVRAECSLASAKACRTPLPSMSLVAQLARRASREERASPSSPEVCTACLSHILGARRSERCCRVRRWRPWKRRAQRMGLCARASKGVG